jgi:hypothetical protein
MARSRSAILRDVLGARPAHLHQRSIRYQTRPPADLETLELAEQMFEDEYDLAIAVIKLAT